MWCSAFLYLGCLVCHRIFVLEGLQQNMSKSNENYVLIENADLSLKLRQKKLKSCLMWAHNIVSNFNPLRYSCTMENFADTSAYTDNSDINKPIFLIMNIHPNGIIFFITFPQGKLNYLWIRHWYIGVFQYSFCWQCSSVWVMIMIRACGSFWPIA